MRVLVKNKVVPFYMKQGVQNDEMSRYNLTSGRRQNYSNHGKSIESNNHCALVHLDIAARSMQRLRSLLNLPLL